MEINMLSKKRMLAEHECAEEKLNLKIRMLKNDVERYCALSDTYKLRTLNAQQAEAKALKDLTALREELKAKERICDILTIEAREAKLYQDLAEKQTAFLERMMGLER